MFDTEERRIRKVMTTVDGIDKVVWEKVYSPAELGLDILTLVVNANNYDYIGYYKFTNNSTILSYVDNEVIKCDFFVNGVRRVTINCSMEDLVIKHVPNDTAYAVFKGTNIEDLRIVRVSGNKYHWSNGMHHNQTALTGTSGSMNLTGGTMTQQWDYTQTIVIPKGNGWFEFQQFIKGYDNDELYWSDQSALASLYYGNSSRQENLQIRAFSIPVGMALNGCLFKSFVGYNGYNFIVNLVRASFVDGTTQSSAVSALPPISGTEMERAQSGYSAWPLNTTDSFRVVGYQISSVKSYRILDINVVTGEITNNRVSNVLPNGSGILYLVLTGRNTMYYCELER